MRYHHVGIAAIVVAAFTSPTGAQERDAAMGKTATTLEAMKRDHGDGVERPASGTFTAAAGHTARGSYEIADTRGRPRLKLGSDFAVKPADDVHVVLSPTGPVPAKGALFLGKLKRFEGTQWFDLPPGIDLSRFSHVVLWSRKTSVAIGHAPLSAGDR